MKQEILSFAGVDFAYGPERVILRGASLQVHAGDYVLLRGPSGAGKSTVLRLCIRLEEPARGVVAFAGKDVRDWPPPQLRRETAYIQQTPTVVPGTVRENLLLPFSFAANHGLARPDDAALQQMLDRFLLRNVTLDAAADSCSVGEKQRLCLIRSLLLKPRVLLMDEPASALDAESAKMVEQAAEELNTQQSIAVLMISHTRYEPGCAHRVLTLANNKLQEESA